MTSQVVFDRKEMEPHGVNNLMISGVLGAYFHAKGAKPVYSNRILSGFDLGGRIQINFSDDQDSFGIGLSCIDEASEEMDKIRKYLITQKENPDYIAQNFHAMWLGD